MFAQYLTKDYLFTTGQVVFRLSDKIYFYFAVALIVLAVVLFILWAISRDAMTKYLLGRWQTLFLTIGILGVLWAAMRYELTDYLSARIAILGIYFIGLIWAVYLVKYQFTGYRRERAEALKEQQRNKYL